MKVFAFCVKEGFGHGTIIVAANSKESAIEIAIKDAHGSYWQYRKELQEVSYEGKNEKLLFCDYCIELID